MGDSVAPTNRTSDRNLGGGLRAAPLVLAALLAVAGTGCQSDEALTQRIHDQDQAMAAQRRANDDLRAKVSAAEKQVAALKADNERLQGRDAAYGEAQAKLEARLKELEGAFPGASGGGGDQDISIEKLPGGGFKFVVQGEVLYASGSADLTADGKAALSKIATALKGRNERVRVEGHTDNVPIVKPETKEKFPFGNLDLSLQRALSAADFLLKEGLDARRVSCAGYGEHQPRSDNGSAEGKKKNRRVEILVQAD